MITVDDLKKYLQGVIESLEDEFEGHELLDIRCNTYGMGNTFLSVPDGFISLADPVIGLDDDDYDEEA